MAFEKVSEKLFGFLSTGEKPVEKEEQDRQLSAFVRGKLEDVRSSTSRIAQEGIVLTNIAYLCGFDSVYFDSLSRQFKPINYPGSYMKKNRVHVNKILPTVQNRLARLLKNPPKYEIRPKSNDEDDKDAARLAKQVLEQAWEFLEINKQRIDLTMWCMQSGHAYFKACWDPMLGNHKILEKEDGSGYDLVTDGDVRVDVCSFFEIYPDPLAKTWRDVKWLIQAKVRDLTYFCDHYEKGHLVKEEECWITGLQYEMRINSLNTQTGSGSGLNPNLMKNAAIELSYYEKPSKLHPAGRHIITAGGQLLKDDILPIDELPFAKFDDVKVGGKYNSEAIITHLRPLQDQINRNKSMRAAWSNRLLAGKYIAARGHGIAAEALTDQSGELLEYDPVPGAPEPHALQVPTVPEYSFKDEEFLNTDINDTAGINEVTRGQPSSGSMPAIGMQLLVEQDDTRIGVEVESQEYSYADTGRIILKFIAKYYKTPRLLKIAGKSMSYDVREFTGDDLNDNFDVHVIRGSTAPGSKVLKRQDIINMHQSGYFGNPQDPQVLSKVLEWLEFGDDTEAWREHALVTNQINRGIKQIEDGIKPPVSEFDKHDRWFNELNQYRISEKFNLLDEEKQSILLEVMEEHFNWMQKMLMPQSAEDLDQDPDMQETTAAQENEQEIMAQAPSGEPPIDEGVMQ